MPHIQGDPTKPAPDCGLRGLDLLDEIIRIIQERPETHRQSVWAVVLDLPNLHLPVGAEIPDNVHIPETCGSAMCVAGWAAHLTGAKLRWHYFFDNYGDEQSADAFYIDTPGVADLTIPEYACSVLGLSENAASELFNPDRTLDEIIDIRDRLRNGEPLRSGEAVGGI